MPKTNQQEHSNVTAARSEKICSGALRNTSQLLFCFWRHIHTHPLGRIAFVLLIILDVQLICLEMAFELHLFHRD